MNNKKQVLENKLNDLENQHHNLYELLEDKKRKYNKDIEKDIAKLRTISIKISELEKKILNIIQIEGENKYSTKEIESAKTLLQECGYHVVRI